MAPTFDFLKVFYRYTRTHQLIVLDYSEFAYKGTFGISEAWSPEGMKFNHTLWRDLSSKYSLIGQSVLGNEHKHGQIVFRQSSLSVTTVWSCLLCRRQFRYVLATFPNLRWKRSLSRFCHLYLLPHWWHPVLLLKAFTLTSRMVRKPFR